MLNIVYNIDKVVVLYSKQICDSDISIFLTITNIHSLICSRNPSHANLLKNIVKINSLRKIKKIAGNSPNMLRSGIKCLRFEYIVNADLFVKFTK